MEFTFRNYEILNKLDSLKELIQISLPIKVSWNVTKNIKKFEVSMKTYIECETELVKKYASKNDDGTIRFDENKQPNFSPNNKEKFKKEQSELLLCEDTLDLLTINLSDLDGKDIKPSTLLNLEFMIVDDSEVIK